MRLFPEEAERRLGPKYDMVLEPLAKDGLGSRQTYQFVCVFDELRL
jgi:hypothetical protein